MTASKNEHRLTHVNLGDDLVQSLAVGAGFGFISALAQGLWAAIPMKKLTGHTLLRTGQFGIMKLM
jgi:hypothetical protein